MAISTGTSAHGTKTSGGTPGRRWRRWLLGGIILVGVAIAAVVFWRAAIASAVLRAGLSWAGFSDARLTVTDITLSRLHLTGVRLGREVQADTADIAFDLIGRTGPAVARLSLGRTRLDFTGPAGPLRHWLDKPQTDGGRMTIRQILDGVAALPAVEVRNLVLRYPVAGQILSVSGSLATERTATHGYHVRYAMRMKGDLSGTARTLEVNGTALVGTTLSLEAGLASSNDALTGSLMLRADLSETEATMSGSAQVYIGQLGALAGFHPALHGVDGRLSLSVRPLSAVTLALDASLDHGGLMRALRRTGSDGLSIEASLAGGYHPGGVEAADATVVAVARNLGDSKDRVRLDTRIGLKAGRLQVGDIALEDMTLEAGVRLDRQNGTVVITLPDKMWARAAKLTADPAGITVTPMALSLRGGRAHALRFEEAASQAHLEIRLDVGASTLRMGKDAARRVDFSPLTVRLSGTRDEQGHTSLQLHAPTLIATERDDTIVIDDLAAAVRRAGDGHSGDLRGRASLHRGGKPFLAPIGIRSNFVLRRNVLTFEGQASAQDAVLSVKNGRHDLVTGTGRAKMAFQPFRFGPGKVSFRTLLPGLTDIDIPAGEGAGNGDLVWGGNGMAGDMSVRIDDMTIAHRSGTKITGLSARLRLDRLVPPRSPPGQVVHVETIAAGVRLDNFGLRFSLIEDSAAESTAVAIEGLTVGLAGGTLKIPPTVLGSSMLTNQATMHVASVDLATLLALLGIDGVSGTGRLSGAIPIQQKGFAVGINGGLLAAEGPGVLRIRSAAVKRALAQGGSDVILMLDAMENFHYQTLSLKIDKALGGEGRMLLNTRGHNPAVRDSQPFVINLNISGNVDRLAALAAQAMRLPADLVRSMLPQAP